MKNDLDKLEQLALELDELRKQRKKCEEKLIDANQRLLVSEEHLEVARMQLKANEKDLNKQKRHRDKRGKELACIHSVSESIRKRENIEDIIKDINEAIILGFQYPSKTCSKVTFFDKEFATDNYRDSKWKLKSDIIVNRKTIGKIEVCYLKESPKSDIGPFHNEEKALLENITDRLCQIIERRNAEQVLIESEAKYRALYDNAPLSYQSLDENGDFIDVNPAWLLTLGYKRGEVIGNNYGDFLHPDWKSHFEKNFPEFKKRGYVHDVHFKIKHKNGHYLDISFEGCIGTNPDGSFKQTYCVFKDVSEQKLVEQALVKNDYYLSKAQEIGKIGTWELDILSNKLYWTKQNYENFGVKYGTKLTYELFLNCIHPDDRDYVNREWDEAIKGKSYDIEHRVIKDNQVHWLREKADINCDENGKAISAIGFTQDITVFKESEQKLTAKEDLYRTLLENLKQGVFLQDADFSLREVNSAALEIFGLTKDQFVGKTSYDPQWEVVDEDLNPMSPEKHPSMRALKTGKPVRESLLAIRNLEKNHFRWVKVNAFPQFSKNDNKPSHVFVSLIDVTDEKFARDKLLESEYKFRILADNTADWEYWIDENNKYVFISPSCEQITGYAKEDFYENPDLFLELVKDEYREEVFNHYHQSERAGPLYTSEFPLLNINGEEVWIEHSCIPIFDVDGKFLGRRGNNRDITERKQTEEEIIIGNKLLRDSQSLGGVGGWSIDVKTMTPYFSEELFNICEIPKSKVPPVEDGIGFFDVEDQPTIKKAVKDCIEKGKPYDLELRFISAKGNKKWVRAIAEAQYNDGKITGITGFLQDISAKKNVEIELHQSQERFELAMKASRDGLYDWNLVTNEIYYSPSWKQMLGYEDNELPNDFSIWESLTEPEDVKRSWEMQQELISRKIDRFELEFMMKHKNGNLVNILSRAEAVFDDNGKAIRIVGTHIDISDHKRIEAELINAKEKAEQGDTLKSAFLSNMSHEIRTPMNGILGFTELLKEPSLSFEEQKDFLRTIELSGARMLNTINNIVDISKIESGVMSFDISDTDINDRMGFAYKFFKPEVNAKGIQLLNSSVLPPEYAIIKTDGEKVNGIMFNLIKNAIKFTNKGLIEFGCEKKGDFLEFFVIDTGIGIEEKEIGFVFERFRQVEATDRGLYEGSGLGLSISKSYVEMLGGKIWVKSKIDKGSTFYFTIPYITESKIKTETIRKVGAENLDDQLKNLEILIVEDDEISAALLRRFVKGISKQILHEVSGVGAVEACKSNPDLDLVLLDIRMPIMDGLEAAHLIRQFNKDIIIIGQSAYAFAGDREKAIKAGCDDYISKPINKTLLLEIIHKHFRK